MVNYCCVHGCGRNSKSSSHLNFYGFPKDQQRLEQWLEAIGREDLREKTITKLTHRVCSRHFAPASIKNRHLCFDAIPTLYLPNDMSEESSDKSEAEEQPQPYLDIVCNSCNKIITCFRYKCISCTDYDLCAKCEAFQVHDEHYMLRIPKPMSFKKADDLIKNWQKFIKTQPDISINKRLKHEGSSDDDVPITKYVKNSDSGIDLSEDVKVKIRAEVERVLNIKPEKKTKKVEKRSLKGSKKKESLIKKQKTETKDMCVGTEALESIDWPEVAFADVNDVNTGQLMEVKDEIPNTLTPLVTEVGPSMAHMKLNEELSEFLIGVKYS